MTEFSGRQIGVEVELSEEAWDALTDYLKDFWRECSNDPTSPDMALSDRIDLFLQEKVAEWLSWLPDEFRSHDLTDGVPF